MELRSLPTRLLRRLCSPVVRAGAIVFFERTLETKVARAAPLEGYSVRVGTARDVPLLLAALPERSERMLLERFARGDRCTLVLDLGGSVAHASWAAFTSAWIPELEMTLTIHPREAYGYDFQTVARLRGQRLFASARQHLCDALQAEGIERFFTYVVSDNAEGLAGAATWQHEAGRLNYLRLRGTRGRVWGSCPFSLHYPAKGTSNVPGAPGQHGPPPLPGKEESAPTANGGSARPLRTEIISEVAALLALRPVWNQLLERSSVDHPFLTHDWICAWWEAFGLGRELRVVVVWSGSTCVAIAPLMGESANMYGIPVRRLELIGNEHTPRSGFVVADRFDEVGRALLEAVSGLREGWDVLVLPKLAEGSATLQQMEGLARDASLSTGVWSAPASPRLRLRSTWPAYLASLRPKQRANLRNRINRLKKLGEVELEEVRGGPALQAALDDGLRIEAAGWKGAAATAMSSCPQSSRFYRRFAESAAARGWLSLHFLKVGGERIAFCYGVRFAGTLFLVKIGYDPKHSAASPAQVLCAMMFEEGASHGEQSFDFLGADEPWKREWTAEVQAHSWLYLFRPGMKTWPIRYAKFQLAPLFRERWLPLWTKRWRGQPSPTITQGSHQTEVGNP